MKIYHMPVHFTQDLKERTMCPIKIYIQGKGSGKQFL